MDRVPETDEEKEWANDVFADLLLDAVKRLTTPDRWVTILLKFEKKIQEESGAIRPLTSSAREKRHEEVRTIFQPWRDAEVPEFRAPTIITEMQIRDALFKKLEELVPKKHWRLAVATFNEHVRQVLEFS